MWPATTVRSRGGAGAQGLVTRTRPVGGGGGRGVAKGSPVTGSRSRPGQDLESLEAVAHTCWPHRSFVGQARAGQGLGSA